MRKFILLCLALVALAFAGQIFFNPHPSKNSKLVEGPIVCFGDSLTYGIGASAGQAYPAQLAAMLSRPVINAGRSGDTTASAAQRLQADVLSHIPRTVIIALGANDLIRGVSQKVAYRNLEAMIQEIQSQGALVIVGGVEVPLRDREYGEMYRRLCRETGAVCVPNILDGIWGNETLMSDPVHPNDAGYRRMAEIFYQALKPYL